METNRAFPQAISLSLGALLSFVFFFALLEEIAHFLPHFLSISQSPWSRLFPAIATLGAAAGYARKLRRQRKARAALTRG